MAVENIIARIVSYTRQCLPGESILTVASGGVYLVVAITAATAVFLRSDVTASCGSRPGSLGMKILILLNGPG